MNKSILTGYQLKWIAIITMLIDHIGYILFPQYTWLRWIGRLSFPIFAFLIVEGFIHTRDVRNYIFRIFLFALATEICYDLAFYNTIWYPAKQNVLFTFTIALIMLMFMIRFNAAGQILVIAIALITAVFMKSDYGYLGVLLVFLLYICRSSKNRQSVSVILWNLCYIPSFQVLGGFSSIFILLYNGERGRKSKYLFYIFYPLHLLVLYIIKRYT